MELNFKKGNSFSSYEAGTVYFEKSTHLLKVGTGASTCDIISGVRSASWNDTTKILTIVNEAGETLTLNFSDVASATEVQSLIDGLDARITGNTNAIATLNGTGAGSVAAAIAAEDSSIKSYADSTFATKTELEEASGDLEALDASVSALETKVTTLVGSDPSKSARTIAAEEVAKIVADASTSYDTLKEISDWIENHEESAATMNSAIHANQDAIAILNGTNTTAGSVAKAALDASTAAYNSAKAYADGLAGNYATAAQGATADQAAADILVLNGGSTVAGSVAKAALDASTAAYNSAKAYADGLASNYATAAQGAKADTAVQSVNSKTGTAVVLDARDIDLSLTTGQTFNYLTDGMTIEGALETLDINVHEAIASAGVTSFGGAAGAITVDTAPASDLGVTFAMSGTKLTGSVSRQDVSTATSSADGLATAYDVKSYVDAAIAAAKLEWALFE